MKPFYIAPFLLLLSSWVPGQSPEKTNISILIIGDYAEPLVGVTVQNLTSKKGAISDVNGQISIETSENDILRFSYTGYEIAEFPLYEIVSGMDRKVVLNSGYILKEVVVTAAKPPLIRMDWDRYDYDESDSLQISFDKKWVYFPNPAVEGITVETTESTGTISVYTLDGRLVCQTTITGPLTKVNMADLPAGTYFLFYENEDWSSPIGKVVLNKL